MNVYQDGVLRFETSLRCTAQGRLEICHLSDEVLETVRVGEWEITPSLSLAEDEGEDHAQ